MINTKKRIFIYILIVLLLIGGLLTACNNNAPATSAAELLSLGERFLLEMNYEQALVQFLQVIEIEPMNPRGYCGAARAHLGLGQIDEAIAMLQRGIELTGDVQLQALLDELLQGDQIEQPDETEQTTEAETAVARPVSVEAPFTAEQRALVDLIVAEMLDGNFSRVVELVALPEMVDVFAEIPMSGDTYRGSRVFRYQGIFEFIMHHEDGVPSTIGVVMNNVQYGEDLLASVYGFFRDPIAGHGVWRSAEYRGGERNGIYKEYRFEDNILMRTTTRQYVNGLRHGEVISTTPSHGYRGTHTSVGTYAYGLRQPVGPASEDGRRIPVYRLIDCTVCGTQRCSIGSRGYSSVDSPNFTIINPGWTAIISDIKIENWDTWNTLWLY